MPSTQLPLGNGLTHDYDPQFKKLTVRGVKTFPSVVLNFADDIEILDLSFSDISELPSDFGRLHRLKIVFLSYTKFEEVPEVLAECATLSMVGMKSCNISRFAEESLSPSIEAITLTDNRLASIPKFLGKLPRLKKLMLSGNQLRELPRELLYCRSLEAIRIAANNFASAPEWLLQLPKLTWYSDAGNPFCAERPAGAGQLKLPTIAWSDLQVGDKIGESAKNVVYRGRNKLTGEAVAIKVYGGEVTTDGYPVDEMRALTAAGSHPNIVGVLARVTSAPKRQQALVMPLIPPEFTQPGEPPNLDTHVRATFTHGQSYTLAFVTEVLRGISAALEHLHARGVMHADIYAHNTLANRTGQAYLCDFGGASVYNPTKSDARQRIDVRAFGYLIEDLLSRCAEKSGGRYGALHQLQRACLQDTSSQRPLFASISHQLQEL